MTNSKQIEKYIIASKTKHNQYYKLKPVIPEFMFYTVILNHDTFECTSTLDIKKATPLIKDVAEMFVSNLNTISKTKENFLIKLPVKYLYI